MKKIIKFLPAMAILLASGLAIATKQPKPQGLLYAKVNGQWDPNPINPADENEEHSGWRCNGFENTCTAYFTSTPSPGDPDPAGAQQGNYEVY